MARFQATERTFTPFAETLPDPLPGGWRGPASRPLEIDVGCHRGRFLVEMAGKYPAVNFLGVERQRTRVESAQKKIFRLGLENAAVVHGEGGETLGRLPGACADYVHILFPDPWPKRRHKTRRMVQLAFLREAGRILKCRGFLRLITDDPDYARAIEFHAACLAGFRREICDGREYPASEFQLKFLADSRPVYDLLLRRVGANAGKTRRDFFN